MRKTVLPRRAVLRGLAAGGAAAAIPLPRLAAMLNGNGTAYAAGAALPKRFGVWFHGIGNVPSRWNPKTTGQGDAWQLSEQLQPFAQLKDQLTVVTGMNVRGGGTIHINGAAGILTGAPHSGDHSVRGPSIDQVIAMLIGGGTPFRSLEIGLCRATANAPTNGTAWNFISHAGQNAPMRPEYDARALFQRLFGKAPGGTGGAAALAKEDAARKSVLDLVVEDAKALRGLVGADDARRLDQHLEGIRDLETRIAALPAGASCKALPANAAETYPKVLPDLNAEAPAELNAALADLIVFALSCDLTRVFSYQWSRPAAHVYFRTLGFKEDFHDDIQHKEPGDQPRVNMAVLYTMGHLKTLVDKMKATPDGAGTLLDGSCLLATTDNSLGRDHSIRDFPILLFGKAGGALRGNLHVRAPNDNPTKVLLSLVNLYGGNVTAFGVDDCRATEGLGAILA